MEGNCGPCIGDHRRHLLSPALCLGGRHFCTAAHDCSLIPTFFKPGRPVAPWLPVELDIGCALFSSQSKFRFDIQPLKTAADGAVQLISISFEFFQ